MTIRTSVGAPLKGRNRPSRITPITGATTKNRIGMATQADSPQLSCSSQYVKALNIAIAP